MLTIDEIREVVTRVGKKYGIRRAYLFGSYAKGEATEESDVDLLIDKGAVHTYKEYFHLCDDLETELGRKVDVTAEEAILPAFYDSIMKNKMMIYGAD